MTKAIVALSIALVLIASALESGTVRVPIDQKDLEVALRGAGYGDTVLVYPGKYHIESRVRSGVKLLSAKGPDSTILWNQRWFIVMLRDCDLETQVSGFTFDGKGCNIAVACTSGAPTITGNSIRDAWDGINLEKCNALVKGNTVKGCNRGIAAGNSSPELIENTLIHNINGMYLMSASPVISRCKIANNSKGIYVAGYSYPTIGGKLTTANDIEQNGYNIYNDGRRVDNNLYTDQREVSIASVNYWGSLCPSKDRFGGEVIFTPWANATHDSTYNECPKTAPADTTKQHR
ncbi:MAG TPA: NosD domain-containing protein [bacterium]|nr:NosD domain-containing protein [bacterium]